MAAIDLRVNFTEYSLELNVYKISVYSKSGRVFLLADISCQVCKCDWWVDMRSSTGNIFFSRNHTHNSTWQLTKHTCFRVLLILWIPAICVCTMSDNTIMLSCTFILFDLCDPCFSSSGNCRGFFIHTSWFDIRRILTYVPNIWMLRFRGCLPI